MKINVKSEVLDLSKRRDSVETRNTPSPYNTSKSTDDSPNARHSECNSSDFLNTDIISDRLTREATYNHYSSIIGRTRSPPFNRSLSPITETNPQNILPISNMYSASNLNPFLLQSAVLQKELVQANNFKNIFETNSNLLISESNHSLCANIKNTRPFKAYPTTPVGSTAVLDNESAAKYALFRKRMLEQITANGVRISTNNKRTRSTSRSSVDSHASTEGSSHIDTINTNITNSIKTKEHTITNNNNVVSNSNTSITEKDESYYERRRKNNAAAKKSRDRRRFKEDEIAIRAAFLERENLELKFENAALRKQLAFYEAAATS